MPHTTYLSLPLDSLYDLLSESIKEMLSAFDSKEDNMIAFKARRKQVELILRAIEEIKKNDLQKV